MNLDSTFLSVNISVSPFSTVDRKKRPRNDRRIQECAMSIQRTFQEAIMGHLHSRTEIVISLHVLAQDGGFFAACINATSLALIDAGVPMYDYVSACSTALYDSISPLLDPNNAEESDLPFLTVATIGKTEKVSMLLLESKVPLDRLESLIAVTISGCHSLRDQMDRQVRKHGHLRITKRSE
ncbi:Ski6p [Sugiyamaella lignohabitans]|uniref:Ski6p n=1 Tax=Sugiyamaella lignohabitans TaxID=796027 RepID=A0A167D414_9ASCO|nr:Ski6p [Sugiyamaella lignohabitans]ANB12450.1 Ski6p [Sugiyamaella lignohabitans]